jgi:hypothetical protein
MNVRNKIWEEIKQAHANTLCIGWYTNRQRKFARYYELFISLVASGGAFGFLFNSWLPFISTLIIAFVSVAKAIFPQFLQPEKELCDLDSLMVYYNKYMADMEKLFFCLDDDSISEHEAVDQLHDMKLSESEKQAVLNKLIRNIPSKRDKKIQNESTEYINRVYYNKYEQQK